MKTIWLIGAGVSKQAHYPLVAEFLDRRFFEKWLIRSELIGRQEIISETLIPQFKKWSKKGYDINALMTNCLEKNDINEIRELNSFIVNVINMVRIYLTDDYYVPYMTIFAELLCTTNSNVITFNYDTLIEEKISFIYLNSYLETKSKKEIILPYNLGLNGKFCRNIQKSQSLIDFGSGYLPSKYPTFNGIKILKIHGSICLMFCTECLMSFYIPPPHSLTSHIFVKDVSHGIELCPRCKKKTDFQMLFVPPASDRKFPTWKLLDSLWKQAEDELKSATHLIISGYSLPTEDKRAFNLLKNISVTNSNLRVLFVNPFLGKKTIKRLKSIFPHLLLLRKTFRELMGIVSTIRTKYGKSCNNLLNPEVISFLNSVVSIKSSRSKCLIRGIIPITKDPIKVLDEPNASYLQQILAINMLSLSENKKIRLIIKNHAFNKNTQFRGNYVSGIGDIPDQESLNDLTKLILEPTLYYDKNIWPGPNVPHSISRLACAGIRQIAYNAPHLNFELARQLIALKISSTSEKSFLRDIDITTLKILENLDVFIEHKMKKVNKKLMLELLTGNNNSMFICHICGTLYKGTPYTYKALNKYAGKEHQWKNLCNHCHLYLREQIMNNENYLTP